MKKLLLFILTLASIGSAVAQSLTFPPNGENQKSQLTQSIGLVDVTITYSSPDVHGPNGEDRTGKIWGEVVHFGYIDQGFGPAKEAPWRAGANENTIIRFSHDVKIEGKDLKAGTYGLFLAVAKEGPSTWIFSKNTSSWGSYYYDAKEDVLRVDATSAEAPYTEWLTYGFEGRLRASAIAYLRWEKKQFSFKIEVPNANELYVNKMRDDLRSYAGFDYQNWMNAARFCVQNKVNLEEALVWADAAVNPPIGQENFNSLQTKASVLTALNRESEAAVVMDKAIKHPTATVQAIHQYGRSLLNSGQKEKALEIFKYNAQSHPNEKFTPNVGLARGYTAMGDKKNALKYWDLAIKNLPAEQQQFLPQYEAEVKKLKEGK